MQDLSVNASVHDGFPTNVSPAAIQSILSHLGITSITNDDGTSHWAIKLQRHSTSSPQQQIIFDGATRSWKLSDVFRSSTTDGRTLNTCTASISPGSPRSHDKNIHLATTESTQSSEPRDWTDSLPKGPHTDLFCSTDWTGTSLGALSTWPKSLRLYTHMILCQQTPSALYVGKDHIAIYNEALIPILGKLHPKFMGASFFECWPELIPSFTAIFEQLTTTGVGIELVDYNAFVQRNGYNEETWWRGNLFPVRQEDDRIAGFCFQWHEATRQVLLDRRTQILNNMGQYDVNQEVSVWEFIRGTLRHSPRDVAMAVLYSFDEEKSGKHRIFHREGVVGVNTDHVAAPEWLDLDASEEGFAPALRTALESERDWISLNRSAANFPEKVLEGIDWQGYGEPSDELIFMPVEVTDDDLRGFIVLGMNPRRAFDADHRQFVSDMYRQLITIMTSLTTHQHAKAREAKLMSELAESEKRIRRIAELAPMGLFDLSADGRMRWANNHYFSIMGLKRPENISETPWIEPVDPSELTRVESIFRECIENDKEFAGTVRLSRTWDAPPSPSAESDSDTADKTHIYFQAFAYREDDSTKSIMGSVTDVSRFVWAEKVQATAASHAQQARSRQEEFVDIVSHELRNPLSAITQCAESILSTLGDADLAHIEIKARQKIVDFCTDAAETILLCAGHQKRIVDDILTLSKLDADLIRLNSGPFQPADIQNEITQMFRYEFTANEIEISSRFTDNGLSMQETYSGDAVRISQVLVNLVTNAIKYQKSKGEHKIEITSGVTSTAPTAEMFHSGFEWSRSDRRFPDVSTIPGYDTGDPLYLYFSVQDTGQGIQTDMATQIFDKFVQTNRRSHVKYGSSGLGLFISRQLCEMQGGLIGVGSGAGVGSTFAFYVQVRKSSEQQQQQRTPPTMLPTTAAPVKEKLNLLLVEDNLVNQKILAKQLVKAGHIVHVANHGGEAVDYISTLFGEKSPYGTSIQANIDNFDCVLMDWEMPVLDGLGATRQIRELERSAGSQQSHCIIGTTANARSEQIDKAIEAGMDAVVTKPFRIADLVARIHEVLAKKESSSVSPKIESTT